MNEALLSQLTQLNLSPNEAKVYLSLLEIGQTSAGEIIKKTRLHRSVVYETLDKLIARKLAFSLEKQKIAFYQAKEPKKLEEIAQTNLELAKSLVPSLEDLLKVKMPEITVYQGAEEWRRYWSETPAIMPKGSVNYVAGSLSGEWQKILGHKFMEKYNRVRIERKIILKMIVFKKDPFELELMRQYPDLHHYRLIKSDASLDSNFNIWGDKLILVSGTEDLMIIEIRNPTLVKGFQNIFNILWDAAKPI